MNIKIEDIKVIEGFNARKVFDPEGLEELAQTIKIHGIIQPLAVKKNKSKYNLIVGERRLRAAKLAGLKEVPCNVLDISDNEAIQIMNIENLQRRDLSPLEEAEGINRILKTGITPEEAALKIGVSTNFIYRRNKLNFLSKFWKECLEYGGIKLTVADKLSRLPENMQEVIKKSIEWGVEKCDGKYFYDSRPVLDAIKNIYNSLEKAPFDIKDEALFKKAGACINCQKRSGCNKMLFPEMDSKEDTCLDVDCFKKKRDIYLADVIIQVSDKTGKQPVLITDHYYSNNDDILGTSDYELSKKTNENAIPAVYVEGEKTGKSVYITRCVRYGSGPMTDEQKVEHRKKIRENKITKNQLSLSVSYLADTFQDHFVKTGNVHADIIDHMIIQKIGYGQSKDFLEYFHERYGWETKVEYNDQNRRELLAENIRSTPVEKKLQLLIDVHFKFTTISDYDHQAMNLAKSIKEIDFSEITKKATELVDKKRNKK